MRIVEKIKTISKKLLATNAYGHSYIFICIYINVKVYI